ncbi:MAG: serine/threonine protein kinase [Pyrinomonadaceae bacterium]
MERLSVNQMVGDYCIVAFIGAGGMGEVYKGVHAKLGRTAAIKVLNKMSPDSSLTTRFFNEARVQSSIYHPNIAMLYDFQEIGDRLFIFMELVDGESLEEMIKRRAFAVEDALKTFQAICEAVAFIHQRGIIHRDIKSQNIKLTSGGVVKLLDFGIAKDAASQNLTRVGGVIGTPRYLAPEQLDGQSASQQTDIWALGVLLYEMLTGKEPFESDSIAMLYLQINEARFEKPEKLNSAISPRVSQIVTRCLTVNKAERYATVDALLEDVRRVLNQNNQSAGGGEMSGFSRQEFVSNGENSNGAAFGESFSNAAPRRKSPFIAIAAGSIAAVILLFSLVGIGIWAMSGSTDGDSPAGNSAIVIPSRKTPVAQNANAAIQQTASNAGKIRIDLFGGSAKVFRDGQEIGVTPLDLEAKNGDRIALTLKRDGFEDKQVDFVVAPGQGVYTFSLKPKE